jgi:hypothetical protein
MEENKMEPKTILCEQCGKEVILTGFTNFCECGEMYNFAGQLLAPVEEWDPEDRYGVFGPQNQNDD